MKTSMQPVCPSGEGTARRYMWRDMDYRAGGTKFGRVVLQSTESLPVFYGDWYYGGG